MKFTLEGRTALVSGGSGLVGLAIVRQFLEEGMNVVTLHSREAKAEMTEKWLQDYAGRFLSISGRSGFDGVLAKVNEKFGRLDVLVMTHGWPPVNQEIDKVTEEYWNSVLISNLTRSFFLMQKAIPYLKNSPAPRIILMTSAGARSGGLYDGLAYTAAKGGIISMTYSTARRLAKYGITVNAVAMGGIYNQPYPVGDEDPEEKLPDYTELLDQIPLGRLGKPEDISAAVCYLASVEAGFVTGEILNVNGGLSMG